MLTQEQKNQALINNGYDPSSYSVDDDGNVFETNKQSPAVGTNEVLTKPESQSPVLSSDTPLTTFGKSALSAAPSSLATGAGTAGGLALASWLLGPEVGLPATLAFGLGGGMLGGYGASKLQQAIEPDSMQQNVAESQATNPKSAIAGSLATLPLAGMNPSPTSSIKALGTLGKLGIGMSAGESELSNLANVGLGAGIGAGTGAAQDVLSGKPLDIKSILENAAIGGLFNKPNVIGKAYGFHPTPPDISELIAQAARNGEPITSEPVPEQITTPDVQTKPTLSPIDVLRGVSSGDVGMSLPKWNAKGQQLSQKEVLTPRKNAQASAADIDMLTRDSVPVEDRSSAIRDYQKQVEYERMTNEKAQQDLRDKLAAQQEVNRQDNADQQSQLAASAMEIKNALQSGIVRPETRPVPLATTPLGREIPRDFTGVTEQNNLETKNESPEDLANRQAEGLDDRYQEERPIERTDFEKQVMDKARAAGLADKPTKNLFDLLNHWFQEKRGVGLRLNSKIPEMGETSVPTDAKSSLLGYLSQINPNKASIDTLFHEPFHVFYNRLKYSDRPSDQRLVSKFENLVKQLPEYQEKFGNDPHGVEEYITSNQGWEAVRRHVLQDKDTTGLKGYFKDMSSYLKTRFSDKASEGDFRRVLDYRFANDPIWMKQHGSQLSGTGVTSTRNQNDRLDKDGYYATVQHDNEVPGSGYVQLDEVKNGQNTRSFSPEEAQKEGLKLPDRNSLKLLEQGKHYLGNGLETRKQEERDYKGRAYSDINSSLHKNLNKHLEQYRESYPEEVDRNFSGIHLGPQDLNKISQQSDSINFGGVAEGAKGMPVKEFRTLIDKTYKPINNQSDRQTRPEDDSVKQAIDNLVKGTDDASIKPEHADELTRALIEQVDWRKAPEVKHLLEQPNFDNLDPDVWSTIKKVYENAMGKRVTLKQAPESQTIKQSTNAEQAPTIKTKNESNKTQVVAQQNAKTNEEVPGKYDEYVKDLLKKRFDEVNKEYQDAEKSGDKKLMASKQEELRHITKIASTRFQEERQPELLNEKITEKMPEFKRMREAIGNPEEANKNEFETANAEERNQTERDEYKKSSFAPFLTSRIDKIAEKFKDNPLAQYASKQLHKFSGDSDFMTGQITNKLVQATRGYDKSSIERVYRYLHQVDDTGDSTINLSNKEKTLSDNIVDILREPRKKQIEMGLQVKSGKGNFRVAGIKPEGYMFNMIDPKVIHEWVENPSSVGARSYDKAYIEHQMNHGATEPEAKELLSDYKGAVGNNASKDTEFGAIRKSEGNGLPWDLVDKNFASASARYGKRAARDLSYFKYIQNDPQMRRALNVRDQFGNREAEPDAISSSKEVKDAMRSVNGIDIPANPKAMAAARAVGNLIMGPGTATRNILNIPSFISNYVSSKQLPLVFKALSNINESKVRAFESNAVKTSFQDFDAAGYYAGNPDPTIRLLDKFSTLARKYQGRDFSDKFEGQYFYSLGELLATDNIAKAKNGDKIAAKWLDRFGDIVDGGSDKLIKGQVTQEDIQRVAKRFVDATRGTYGEEGLPGWAIEGSVSPFAALSRFGIEKSNTIYKDVINPLKGGNIRPLLAYTLSSLGVGLATEKLNELLSNKRGNDPTLAESLASDKPEEMFAKAVGLLQLSTFAGVVSDGAKLATDAALGRANIKQNTLSFPLYDFVTDTVGSNVLQAAQAIKQGEDPFQVMAKLAQVISTSSVQSMRYANNNFIEPDKTKRKEAFRDLSTYEQMEGLKSGGDNSPANEFQNLGAKEFKETDDVSEAASELPDLISRVLKQSSSSDGMIDIEKLRSKLDTIKQNNYQTMPSPDDMPLRFLNYLNFLKRTQGDEAANERLLNYFKQRAVNTAKSEMVPSI